ncbi:MAG: hypothetical protein ACLRNW_22010 [Neglectibacter sp.]
MKKFLSGTGSGDDRSGHRQRYDSSDDSIIRKLLTSSPKLVLSTVTPAATSSPLMS